MNPIILAPTTLPDTAPLAFIDAGTQAGYDGLSLRLNASPGLPFHPVIGDAPLIAEMKRALKSAPPVFEIGSFYLQPDTDVATFSAALALGAEFGARCAFVIGNDPDHARLTHTFGSFCDLAGQFGLSAFVEFVPMRPLATLPQTLRLFADAGRPNVAVCIDPLNFVRSGGTAFELKTIDPKFLPYAQISDGDVHTDESPSALMRPNVRRMLGEGGVPLRDILGALPPGLPLSVELPRALSVIRPGARGKMMPATEWAKHVLAHVREFLTTIAAE